MPTTRYLVHVPTCPLCYLDDPHGHSITPDGDVGATVMLLNDLTAFAAAGRPNPVTMQPETTGERTNP